MIRNFRLADLFTLGNGFAGMGAVLALLRFVAEGEPWQFWAAVALFPVAWMMDFLDGRIARGLSSVSPLGHELDSLADLVSFGVAPAVMAFAIGFTGGFDAIALVLFVGCGISRLARFNVTATEVARTGGPQAKVPYFEGFPIPSSLLLVAGMAALKGTGHVGEALPLGSTSLGPITWHPLSLIFVLHGGAMISKTLHIPKP